LLQKFKQKRLQIIGLEKKLVGHVPRGEQRTDGRGFLGLR